MPPKPRQVPVSPSPEAARRRLHIHGIREMPSGYDAEVAALFRDLRAASHLSETDLAQRLATRIDVVQALEQGALYALPPWPETCRIVNGYGALLNLDVRPLLRRIYAQLEAGIVELGPKAMPELPVMEPRENGQSGSNSGHANSSPAQAPQAPWPGMTQSPPGQAPWPGAPPSPQQASWPGAQPASAPQQAWPAPPSYPQAGWPGAPPAQTPWPSPPPQSQPAAPQARPDGWAQPGHNPAYAPQPQPEPQRRPQPQAQPQAQPQPRMQPPAPQAGRAEQPPAAPEPLAVPPPEEEEPARGRPMLLKWGLGALIVSVVAFGLWMALGDPSGPLGGKSLSPTGSPGQVLDPDDPRSRKSDRLPSAF
jgi:hypothetical protein